MIEARINGKSTPAPASLEVDQDALYRNALEAEVAEMRSRLAKREAQLHQSRAQADALLKAVLSGLRAPLQGLALNLHELNEAHGDDPEIAARCAAMRVLMDEARNCFALQGAVNPQDAGEDRLSREFTNASAALTEILEAWVPDAPNGNAFEFEIDDALKTLYVWLDARLLKRVLGILLKNANQHTRDGKVRVSVGIPPGTFDELLVVVSDTGEGIPRRWLKAIMEPFITGPSRFSRAEHGVGIGLSIAARLMMLCDGKMHIESQVGRGTTVFLSIPTDARIPRATAARIAPALVGRERPVGVGRRVLVADDDEGLRWLIEKVMRAKGFDVCALDNGADAWRRIAEGGFDVAVLDHDMPEVSATKMMLLWDKLAEPKTRLIMLTSSARALNACRESRFVCLGKPVVPQLLIAHVIESCLQ